MVRGCVIHYACEVLTKMQVQVCVCVYACVLQLRPGSIASPSFIILQHKVLPQPYRNSCFFQAATENRLLPQHTKTPKESVKLEDECKPFFLVERADYGCPCSWRQCLKTNQPPYRPHHVLN